MCNLTQTENTSFYGNQQHKSNNHQLYGRTVSHNGTSGVHRQNRRVINPYETSLSSPAASSKNKLGIIYIILCLLFLLLSFVCYIGSSPFSSSTVPYNENYHYEEIEEENTGNENESEHHHGFGVPDLEDIYGFDALSDVEDLSRLDQTRKSAGRLRGSASGTAASSSSSKLPQKQKIPKAETSTPKVIPQHKYKNFEPQPIVIAGPSGVGKGTLINRILQKYNLPKQEEPTKDKKDYFGFSVSHTTRQPRPGEVDGEHYHYTTMENMKAMVERDEFVEHAGVHGNMYGTSYEAVESVTASERICILDIDVQGVKNIKQKITSEQHQQNTNHKTPSPYFIFVAPPSMEILEQRLRDRKTESEADITKRLSNAAEEVKYGREADNFDEVIVNDDLDRAFKELSGVLEAWYPHLKGVDYTALQ